MTTGKPRFFSLGRILFFHTFPLNCPSRLLELTLSHLRFRRQEGRREIKSLLFKETIWDILLVFLCSPVVTSI